MSRVVHGPKGVTQRANPDDEALVLQKMLTDTASRRAALKVGLFE